MPWAFGCGSPGVREGRASAVNSLYTPTWVPFSPVLSSCLPSMQTIPTGYSGFPGSPGKLRSLALFFLPGTCFSFTLPPAGPPLTLEVERPKCKLTCGVFSALAHPK